MNTRLISEHQYIKRDYCRKKETVRFGEINEVNSYVLNFLYTV